MKEPVEGFKQGNEYLISFNRLTEIQFTHYTINPLEVCISIVFSILIELSSVSKHGLGQHGEELEIHALGKIDQRPLHFSSGWGCAAERTLPSSYFLYGQVKSYLWSILHLCSLSILLLLPQYLMGLQGAVLQLDLSEHALL